jgi:hypothetical protein
MRAIGLFLRVFCYLFQTALSLALLALGCFAVLSGTNNMKLQTLPWEGAQLNYWLIGLGVVGLLSVLLAITSTIRFLLPLWSINVLWMLVKGVILSPTVTFDGRDDFSNWLWLIGGAALALIGSFTLFEKRRV